LKIANIKGRAVLVRGDKATDIHLASGGRFGPDPQQLFDRWEDFRSWADGLDESLQFDEFHVDDAGPPSPTPRQVFAAAVNYRLHADEGHVSYPDHPAIFTKFPTCISGPFDDIQLAGETVDWEVELVAVIGREARNIEENEAWSVVAGLTVGQDISERTVQMRPPLPQFCLGKSFTSFGPTGPLLVTPDEFPDAGSLELGCSVNGIRVQHSSTERMLFSLPQLVSHLSSVVTLLPGDLIFTGTPEGVGTARNPKWFLRDGDTLESYVTGIGTLINKCRQPALPSASTRSS
jgi:2-keto-4-pentenoate hydratase/2-oxohepta-3-ene-1,7-dioic acid hydratase in catechol pathway